MSVMDLVEEAVACLGGDSGSELHTWPPSNAKQNARSVATTDNPAHRFSIARPTIFIDSSPSALAVHVRRTAVRLDTAYRPLDQIERSWHVLFCD